MLNNLNSIEIPLPQKIHETLLQVKGLVITWSREVAQSLCNPMDCSLPRSIHGIFQARVLEWIAISFSKDLPDPEIKPGSPAL